MFIPVSFGYHLQHSSVPGEGSFPTFCSWICTNPATGCPGRGWPSSPINREFGIAACLGQASSPVAAGHVVRCTPKPWTAEGEGNPPGNVLDPWEKPEGCLGMRQEPSECQLQALGMSVTQEQLRRTLYVIYTSSMSISCNTRKLNQQCNILITKIFRQNSVYFSSGLSSSFTGQDIKIIIYLYL